MIFEVHSENRAKDKKIFYYDNMKNVLSDESGFVFEYSNIQPRNNMVPTRAFSKEEPLRKSKNIINLKIQMGLSCNYSCSYCSQKFVKRPAETSKKDIDAFMAKLEVLDINEESGLKVEFWGGEPFVYWKTMKPLAEAFEEKYGHWKKKPSFSVITNGSLLTREICSWLYYMGFSVGISHDGPGQHVRGPDPFEDEEKRDILLEFYKVMHKTGRISFNSMMNSSNQSRKELHDWFVNLTGDPTVAVGEGSFIDAYDEDGANSSLPTLNNHFNYRRNSFNDFYGFGKSMNFPNIYDKVDGFTRGVLSHFEGQYVGQKCGMDDEHTIAVDLNGNVVTCQNVSVKETSKNGEPHLGGNLNDYDNIALKSVTHWKNRNDCADCPVLQLCRGSCMYLDGKYWDITCDSAFSDNISLFALAFANITGGYIPTIINNKHLPLDRQDIWGTFYKHENVDEPKFQNTKVVVKKIGMVNDVEVYGAASAEG
jgi:uncharacterized protein